MLQGPLVDHIYTADPSAHVFNGRIHVYPCHDRDTDIKFNDDGDQHDMADYHVLSLEGVDGAVTDHGTVFGVEDVPWASKQLWAPDAAYKNGRCYFYFPAKDKKGVFRMGVAASAGPHGPFKVEPDYMPGSYSIDPASFVDDDGQAYLYFGGIWGGQLQCWSNDAFDKSLLGHVEPCGADLVALSLRAAKLSEDMLSFQGPAHELQIVDEEGESIMADDHDRRFFEASWMHKY